MHRIFIVTEDEPFYIAKAMRYFLSHIPDGYTLSAAIVLNYFHTQKIATDQIGGKEIINVFGFKVLARMVWRFLIHKINKSKQVARVFQDKGIFTLQKVRDIHNPEIVQFIQEQKPDLLIAIGVNCLFQPALREIARLGCINVHTGIHPEHRGRAAMFWALADGYTETGVTVHLVDKGVDSGKVILTKRYPIIERSLDRLLHDLRFLSMDTLNQALELIRDDPACLDNWENSKHSSDNECRRMPTIHDLKAFAKLGNKIF